MLRKSSLTNFIKEATPPILLHSAKSVKRMMEDLRHSLFFALNLRKQKRALDELRACETITDHIAFTRRWLGVGSVQIQAEIEAALKYVAASAPRRICEIGTECGGTNLLLSQSLHSSELIIGIDLYVKNRPQLGLLRRAGQQIHLINGSSHSLLTLKRVERVLHGRKLDVLFIDGDHRYESVKKDFLLYRRFVREKGLVLFHDIVPDHGARYGRTTHAFSGGVPILWEQLKQIYPFREFVQNPEQDGMGIGVIEYSALLHLPQMLDCNFS